MTTPEHPVPRHTQAAQQWRELDSARRRSLLRGGEPADGDEARIALGFAFRMQEWGTLFAVVGAASAFVIVIALELLMEPGLDTDSFILAGAIAVGVGLGLAISGRRRARRLERRAREWLAESDSA